MRFVCILVVCMMLFGTLIVGCGQVNTSNPDELNHEPVRSKVISTEINVQEITFHSKSLDRDMIFNIYLPKGYEAGDNYPVLYIFHGHGSNQNFWIPYLGLDQVADAMINEGVIKPLIIVSPNIDISFGINSKRGKYGDYIIHDLIDYVDRHYNTDASRESRYIGGLSMGGWTALHQAFLHPELFSKVGGHSPAVYMNDWSQVGDLKSFLYPNKKTQAKRDPIFLADTQDLKGLSIYLDVGDKDNYKFYQGAEALHNKLQSHSYTSEYHLFPGLHERHYWMEHLRDYLLFYSGL
jgi:enterochelin esterase-like enzyme